MWVGGGAILSLGIHHIKGRHSVANQYNIVEVSGWRVVVKSVISVRKKVLCLEDCMSMVGRVEPPCYLIIAEDLLL